MNRSGPYLGDELGRFLAAVDMSQISERALRSLKRNVLDTLGCAIAADAG
jgi:2-methylcitrate dehydratase PrpD